MREHDEDRFTIATDEEVMEIEDKARSRTVLHWPELVRLINRLRKAEEELAWRRDGDAMMSEALLGYLP